MSNLSEERLVGIDNSDDGNHSVDHDQGAVAVERYEASAESDSKDVNDLTKDSSSDDSKTAPTGSAAAAAAGTAGQPKTNGSKKQSGNKNKITYGSDDDDIAIMAKNYQLYTARKAKAHGVDSRLQTPRERLPTGGRRAGNNSRTNHPLPFVVPGVPETDMPAHWLAVKDALDKNHNKQIVNGLWTAAIAVDKANLAKHQAELEAARANRQTADSAVRTYQDRSSSQHERIQSLEAANQELNEEVDRLKARAEAAESAAATASSKSFVQALAKPSQFHGSKKKDKITVTEWLDTVRDYLYSSKIASTTVQEVQIAESLLHDEARRGWKAAKIDLQTPGSSDPYAGITFDVFAKHLESRWNPTCTTVEARFKLDALQQQGMTMPHFISKFEDLCTHFPNMDEDDKIHRFLTKLHPRYATELAVDPATRQRWNSYLKLKEYATNYAATVVSNAALLKRPRAGVLSAIHDMAGEAADQMQTGDGWEAARPRKRASPSKPSNSGSYAAAAAGGARTTGSPHPDFITRSNAKGDSFSRHKNVIKYCHANSLCICCYSKYTDATKAQHREHCTAAPKPDKVFPVGYKYNKSG